MTKPKGFLQMFAIPPTGGGTGMHLDFHLDTHRLWEKTDLGGQEKAKQDSKKEGKTAYKDKVGDTWHTYENGRETTMSSRSSNSSVFEDRDPHVGARGDYPFEQRDT